MVTRMLKSVHTVSYFDNYYRATIEAIEGCPVAMALLAYIQAKHHFYGTYRQL